MNNFTFFEGSFGFMNIEDQENSVTFNPMKFIENEKYLKMKNGSSDIYINSP